MNKITAFLAGTLVSAAVLFPAPAALAGDEAGFTRIPGADTLRSSYTLTFASEAVRLDLAQYLRQPAQQLRDAGVDISIGGVGPAVCTAGSVYVAEIKNPFHGKPGYSKGYPCRDHGVVTGGAVLMNSEYDYLGGTFRTSQDMRLNGVAHELGHALGLDHPKCTKDRPQVMCSPNGGFRDARAGLFTQADLAGFDSMRKK